MKRMILAFGLVLASTSAFAWGGQQVEHDYSAALGEIALENACLTDTEVRSISPVSVCEATTTRAVQVGDGQTVYEPTCVRYSKQHVAHSRTYSYTTCERYVNEYDHLTCVEYGSKKAFLPATIKVRVWDGYGDHSYGSATEKSFTFPRCK